MQEWQKRVLDEKNELDDKIEKLNDFIAGDLYFKLDRSEQIDLQNQVHFMYRYSEVLGRRISRF